MNNKKHTQKKQTRAHVKTTKTYNKQQNRKTLTNITQKTKHIKQNIKIVNNNK